MNAFWKWIERAVLIMVAIWAVLFVDQSCFQEDVPPPKWGDEQLDSLSTVYDAQFTSVLADLGILTVQTDSLGTLSITIMERAEDLNGRLRYIERRPSLKCNQLQIIKGGSYKCIP